MNYATRGAAALVLGVGLATAAQAQDTYSQSAAPGGQSATPAPTLQNPAPAARMHRGAPVRMHKASAPGKVTRQQVRMAQQQLKSDGLYRGRIDGVMNHRMHLAIARFQKQNGLPRTASLDRNTLDRLTGGQRSPNGLGVGSSMPNQPNAMNNPKAGLTPVTPPTNPATTGAGEATAPNNPTTKY